VKTPRAKQQQRGQRHLPAISKPVWGVPATPQRFPAEEFGLFGWKRYIHKHQMLSTT
jgi:hypothetical protein